jgi:hypothetical protein
MWFRFQKRSNALDNSLLPSEFWSDFLMGEKNKKWSWGRGVIGVGMRSDVDEKLFQGAIRGKVHHCREAIEARVDINARCKVWHTQRPFLSPLLISDDCSRIIPRRYTWRCSMDTRASCSVSLTQNVIRNWKTWCFWQMSITCWLTLICHCAV